MLKGSTTHLIALVALLTGCAGFTIGLTYAPCFASLCSEEFYPDATRWHIAGFYAMIGVLGLALLLRASSTFWRTASETLVVRRELSFLHVRLSVGGVALVLWLTAISFATAGFWTGTQMEFWSLRTAPLEWRDAQFRLTATGVTGHFCDMALGFLILPISRNSIIGKTFALGQSTLLYAHKVIAYAFLVVVFAHGAAYYTFVAAYAAAQDPSPRKDAFEIDNPTLTLVGAEQRGYYYFLTLPTGMAAFLVLLVIVFTSLPKQRRRNYNTFYYAHIICSSLIFVFAGIHASTDFYFMLPGLLLWAFDWAWRLRGGSQGLSRKVTASVEDGGDGWIRLSLPADFSKRSDLEKQSGKHQPIQSFHLNIPSISKVQNHAFTAASIGSSSTGSVLLLRKAQMAGKKESKLDKEWTWELSKLVESHSMMDGVRSLEIRVEGPYSPTELTSFDTANHIICLVCGTGITGALSLAQWWLSNGNRESQFDIIWTIRTRGLARLREWQELQAEVAQREDDRLGLKVHCSSESGRLDMGSVLRQAVEKPGLEEGKNYWVYASGPEGLLSAASEACVEIKRELHRSRKNGDRSRLDFYAAKWEA